MNRKQFLLTKNKKNYINLEETHSIGEYDLYLGKDSEYCYLKSENRELHLIGSMYDWENPQFSNKQILQIIFQNQRLEDVLRTSDKYCGEFVLIAKLQDEIF
jgi:hypothetical protein